ncbi:MAG: glycosyltransferase family 4 protein [Candidatus Heimdallarchaeota archaeon]
MKKIFILSPLALENGRGGEISSMELATGLSKYYNVIFSDTNRLSGNKLLSRKIIMKKLKDIKKIYRLNFATASIGNKYFDIIYPWEFIKLIRLTRDCDIIYTSVSNFKISSMFMILSIINRRAKFIIGYRRPLHSNKLFSIYNIRYRLTILLYSLFKKRIYHHALSDHGKMFLDKFYNPQKVFHITHGIELKDYSEIEFNKNPSELLKFVYIGYLDDIHKGIKVLLRGIEKFIQKNQPDDIIFEFCGMGPLDSEVKALETKYPQYVKFNGYINYDKIHYYYKKSDVFLFSSRREPFPRVLMEALAAKLVIICSKTIGSLELLKNKEFAFFINKLNSEEISGKILEVYKLWKSDNTKFKHLQNLAQKFIFNNYSTEIEINLFRDWIEKITKI